MDTYKYLLVVSLLLGSLQSAIGAEEMPTESRFLTTFKSENYRGRIVLLNFWATYCGPCREEIPHLVELKDHFAKQPVEILGVSVDRGKADKVRGKLEKFVERYKINYPIVLDPELALVKAFGGFNEVPTTFLLDAQGQIVTTYKGAQDRAILQADIQTLLDGS